MSEVDHETRLVNAFVVTERRARLIGLLRHPKRRSKVLARLYHFDDLEPHLLVPIEPSKQNAAEIATLLTQRGAPPTCYVISTDGQLDGRELPLADVLSRIVGAGEGSLVSCIPGRLAYFEGESPKDRYILERS